MMTFSVLLSTSAFLLCGVRSLTPSYDRTAVCVTPGAVPCEGLCSAIYGEYQQNSQPDTWEQTNIVNTPQKRYFINAWYPEYFVDSVQRSQSRGRQVWQLHVGGYPDTEFQEASGLSDPTLMDVCVDVNIESPADCSAWLRGTVSIARGLCGVIPVIEKRFIPIQINQWYRALALEAYPQHRPAHLFQVEYDEELTVSAQTWADQCHGDYEPNIDLGEAVWTWSISSLPEMQAPEEWPHDFFTTVLIEMVEVYHSYQFGDAVTAHNRNFLTMISDQQRAVGCGYKYCPQNVDAEFFLVCRFTATFIGPEPFVVSETGEAGSGCADLGAKASGFCFPM